MAFKHRRRSLGCRGRSGPKEFWQMRSQVTARSGFASSVLRHMCGRGGVADVVGTTSLQLYKASTSRRCMRRMKNGTLARRPRVGEKSGQEEIKRLRAQVELPKQQGTGKSPEEPREPARRGSGLEEGCKMEFDEETDCKNKLEEQKTSRQRQLRDIEKFASKDLVFRERQKEVWDEELEEIERKRTELLPEHQKMQKRSQEPQSLRDKQRNHLKNRVCQTELQTLGSSGQRKEIGKETGMVRRSLVGGMQALRWILLWILIGVRMQTVEAAEEEIQARREMERMLEMKEGELGNMGKKK